MKTLCKSWVKYYVYNTVVGKIYSIHKRDVCLYPHVIHEAPSYALLLNCPYILSLHLLQSVLVSQPRNLHSPSSQKTTFCMHIKRVRMCVRVGLPPDLQTFCN
jgi:hypothetical protein